MSEPKQVLTPDELLVFLDRLVLLIDDAQQATEVPLATGIAILGVAMVGTETPDATVFRKAALIFGALYHIYWLMSHIRETIAELQGLLSEGEDDNGDN